MCALNLGLLVAVPQSREGERGRNKRKQLIDDALDAQTRIGVILRVHDILYFDHYFGAASGGDWHILVVRNLRRCQVRYAVQLKGEVLHVHLVKVVVSNHISLLEEDVYAYGLVRGVLDVSDVVRMQIDEFVCYFNSSWRQQKRPCGGDRQANNKCTQYPKPSYTKKINIYYLY